jgi:hypothetical protein
VADKDPSDVPAVPIPPLVDLTGNGDEAKPAAKPRKKAEPKAVPPAVPPVEAAPVAPAASAAPAAPVAPEVPVNPYAAASAPAAAQPNPYAAPQPYASGPYVPQPPKGLAIASMILGIAGLVFCGTIWLVSVAAVVTGHLAQKRQPYARGMWLTGLITGYIGAVIGLFWGALWLIPIFMGFTTYGLGSF